LYPSKLNADFILSWSLRVCAIFASCIAASIVYFLWLETRVFLDTETWSAFSVKGLWSPTEGHYNLTPMIVASLLTTVLALVIAGPIGIFSAIFSQFYATESIRRIYQICIEILAGIPSIIYGFWGLTVLVPFINRHQPPGASLLAGSLVLSIMILPTIALITNASFASVPRSSIRAAYAMGMSRYGIFRAVVYPYCRAGIVTALLLACGRAMGETMAMIMVCGNIVQIPQGLFDPVRTLPANIALEMAYATGSHRSVLFLSGFILTLLVMIMVALSHGLLRSRSHET